MLSASGPRFCHDRPSFPILQALHQLEGVCGLIVDLACEPGTPAGETVALYHDLNGNTWQSILQTFDRPMRVTLIQNEQEQISPQSLV